VGAVNRWFHAVESVQGKEGCRRSAEQGLAGVGREPPSTEVAEGGVDVGDESGVEGNGWGLFPSGEKGQGVLAKRPPRHLITGGVLISQTLIVRKKCDQTKKCTLSLNKPLTEIEILCAQLNK
jgi:hypothetical protein